MGGLGPLSGPMWAVLGCLGASVGGLGPLSGPLRAVLARDQAEKWPFLEREGDQDRGSGRKVALTRAGSGPKAGLAARSARTRPPPGAAEPAAAEAPYAFFSIDII